ncbi:hypothetical protein SNE40_010993 [Patella caerulea]|uniref:Uncharacterized protein n=1 Tax=Patella caerulea TaxID=87958 RepID=A0AAN8PTD0_PATCE
MPLSAAEKQRWYRQRRDADPERRARYLQNEKDKYIKDKETGKKKQVKDMSKREHRLKKKEWRQYKKDFKARQKAAENILTPPGSPIMPVPAPPSRQRKQAVRNRSRAKSKIYRKISLLETQLELEKKRAAKYKKRFQREKTKLEETPRKKTRKLLRNLHRDSKKTVHRTLSYHFSLMDQMKHNYKHGKKSIAEVAAGEILKKYKFRQKFVSDVGIFTGSRLRRSVSLSFNHALLIRAFYERGDVSRIITGQKCTVTRKKIKKQRRVLCDNLKNLYDKFQSEHQIKISFTTFWRKKPFWITYATEKDRNTCLCKTCENMKFMSEALFRRGVISTSSLNDLVKEVVCSTNSKICMYGECGVCKQLQLKINKKDQNAPITWSQWRTKKEKRKMKNGQEKEIILTVKEEEHGSVADLLDKFYEHLWVLYRRHTFNISNQYNHYRKVRGTLTATQCFIHIDFAENFVGKMSSEIQSMHFGASQSQITLHTGYYIVGGMAHPVSFCGLSDSLQHDPASVWAFLKPVLTEIRNTHPSVNSLEFYSDGPTTQYKQKKNFYLFSTEVFKFGFTKATWNFHEGGHGKGIPDGVGASVKRSADRLVRNGTDIMNARSMMNALQKAGTTVKLYVIEEPDIKCVETSLNITLKRVPGTMKMHQLITTSPGVLKYRDVSCICVDAPCSTHMLREVCMIYQDKQQVSGSMCKDGRSVRQTRCENIGQNKTNDDQTKSGKGIQKKESDEQKKSGLRMKKVRTNQEQLSKKKTLNENNQKKKPRKRKSVEVFDGQNSSNKKRKRHLVNDGMKENNECFFPMLLSKLDECNTFEELKIKCETMHLPEVQGSSRFILHGGFNVDTQAMDMYPTDTPHSQNRYPVIVRADGDCLPACGSVFAYGHDNNTDEMRLRIIHELALNVDYYLEECNLTRGLTDGTPKKTEKCFCYVFRRIHSWCEAD